MSEAKANWFVGLDVHTKSIAICVLDATGKVVQRETIESRRRAWRGWLDRLPADVAPKFALVQAALQLCRWSGEIKERYGKLRRRIKRHKARVAIARRLAVASSVQSHARG